MHTSSENIAIIRDLSNAFGPSGFEDDVVAVIRHHAKGLGIFEEDSLRNLYLYRKENTGNRPVLMLDAHSDETGFMVHSIETDGLLRFVQLGGWDKFTLSSNKVLVRNAEGAYITGILVSCPYHCMTPTERNQFQVDVAHLRIDIGASSRNEAIEKFKIRIGEPVAPATRFEIALAYNTMYGKAFDCRLGCAALLETLFRIEGEKLPFDIVAVFSAQEELGDRGCRVAVTRVKPQVAFCFEACPADDVFSKEAQSALQHGPMMRFMDRSIITSPRYQRYVLDLAEKKHLQVQCAVKEHGGTNASVINTAYDGVPVVVAGIPVRYTHTCNCIAHYNDFEATVQLAVETIKSLSIEIISKF